MQSQQITDSKKRNLTMMMAKELDWKLKSKANFVQYLDKL